MEDEAGTGEFELTLNVGPSNALDLGQAPTISLNDYNSNLHDVEGDSEEYLLRKDGEPLSLIYMLYATSDAPDPPSSRSVSRGKSSTRGGTMASRR